MENKQVRTDYSSLKIGDELTRCIGGILMGVVVGHIDEKTFKAGSIDGAIPWEEGWTFNKETGLEIDEDLE